MTQLSSFNQFGTKSEQFSQFTHRFHTVQTCLGFFGIFDFSDITFKLLIQIYTYFDLIMPKPVYLMTVHEAHKDYNSIIDQIRAKYELLDSGECEGIDTPAFKAKSCELAHLMAQMSDLCKHLKLPIPKDLQRPPHFKH